uniref:Uncharacterized protein n=1 Tax=Marseillevirus LCMAC101 TaxID=2506602 RepID=A0A481YQL4_9VIRU|nr:MAG: hypothetical protein LCMAC101_01200 [Marseillevirus LCMAC101]
MADVKKLKVVLIKSGCQRIGGGSDKRLIKSLSVRVHTTTRIFRETNQDISISICIEIWEPLIPKKWTYQQKKIFYKDAYLAVIVGASKDFGNYGIVRDLRNNTDEASFQLGKDNVVILGDPSMGGGRKGAWSEGMIGHTGENGREVLEQIQDIALEKYLKRIL